MQRDTGHGHRRETADGADHGRGDGSNTARPVDQLAMMQEGRPLAVLHMERPDSGESVSAYRGPAVRPVESKDNERRGRDGRALSGLECEVSRRRASCGVAIVRHGSASSAAARQGLGPVAIRKEAQPCEGMVAGRSCSMSRGTPVGFEGSASEWVTTSAALIRRRPTSDPTNNWNSVSDGRHMPVGPAAAHQLQGGRCAERIERVGAQRRGKHHRVSSDWLFDADRSRNDRDATSSIRQARGSIE